MEDVRGQVPHLGIDIVESEYIALAGIARDSPRAQSDHAYFERAGSAQFTQRNADTGLRRVIADGLAVAVPGGEFAAVDDGPVLKLDHFPANAVNPHSQRAVKIPHGNENSLMIAACFDHHGPGDEQPEVER